MSSKVSVIIPVYNVEKYLRQCLDSVINQTLAEIEIICVNDGSTDNSLEILQEYAQRDNRIKIVNQENQGLGAARNNGITFANTDYLFFVDSDDFIDLKCLEILYQAIDNTNADLCLLGIIDFDDKTKKCIQNNYKTTQCYNKEDNAIFNYKEIKDCIFKRFYAFTKIYRRDFFIQNKLYFDEGVFFEDVVSHVKSLICARQITIINKNLYVYRCNRSNSIMSISKSQKDIVFIKKFMLGVKKILENYDIFEELSFHFFCFIFQQGKFHFNRLNKDCKQDFKNEVLKLLELWNFNEYLDKYKKNTIDNNYYYHLKKEYDNFVNKKEQCKTFIKVSKKDYIKLTLLERIFSIKKTKNKEYKIITILNFKIKVKNNKKQS